MPRPAPRERQVTQGPGGRVLTHANVWRGDWVVYDTRSNPAGETFDGRHVRAVHAATGEVRTLYTARHGAHCGVATWHPHAASVSFILGPERPGADWSYGPARRQGVTVEFDRPHIAENLDARDLLPPFTPGALRGGSHVHMVHPAGRLVSFTYDDHVLSGLPDGTPGADRNQRNVAVGELGRPVSVPGGPRNHGGSAFCAVVTRTVNAPRPGSDEIARACEEAWVGDGRTLAFQGEVVTAAGQTIREAFAVDLPTDLARVGDGPLEGTPTRRPAPPAGTVQRRLTDTTGHRHPGLAGPRHWLRSSPAGDRVGFLKRDDAGVVQFWTVPPWGGAVTQVTRNAEGVASAFTWHPAGGHVAFVVGDRVCVTDIASGVTRPVTGPDADPPRPEACVFSPTGAEIAFVRTVAGVNQICVVAVA